MNPLFYPPHPHFFVVLRGLNCLLSGNQLLHCTCLDTDYQVVRQLVVLDQPQDEVGEVLRTHARRICLRHVLLVHASVAEVKSAFTTRRATHLLALCIGSMEHQRLSTEMRILVEPGSKKLAFHLHLPPEIRQNLFFVHLHLLALWKLCKVLFAALAGLIHCGHKLQELVESSLQPLPVCGRGLLLSTRSTTLWRLQTFPSLDQEEFLVAQDVWKIFEPFEHLDEVIANVTSEAKLASSEKCDHRDNWVNALDQQSFIPRQI